MRGGLTLALTVQISKYYIIWAETGSVEICGAQITHAPEAVGLGLMAAAQTLLHCPRQNVEDGLHQPPAP